MSYDACFVRRSVTVMTAPLQLPAVRHWTTYCKEITNRVAGLRFV